MDVLDAWDPEWWMAKGVSGNRACYVPRESRSYVADGGPAARIAAARALKAAHPELPDEPKGSE
jgi:hypothetical protein